MGLYCRANCSPSERPYSDELSSTKDLPFCSPEPVIKVKRTFIVFPLRPPEETTSVEATVAVTDGHFSIPPNLYRMGGMCGQ